MGSLVFNSGISDIAEGISAPAKFQFSHTNNRNKTTTEENASSRRSNSYSFGSAPTGPAVRADMNSVDPRLRQRIRCITSSQGMPDGPSLSRASSRRSSSSRCARVGGNASGAADKLSQSCSSRSSRSAGFHLVMSIVRMANFIADPKQTHPALHHANASHRAPVGLPAPHARSRCCWRFAQPNRCVCSRGLRSIVAFPDRHSRWRFLLSARLVATHSVAAPLRHHAPTQSPPCCVR